MIAAFNALFWPAAADPPARTATDTPPPRPGPIFITDAVTPWRGGTALLEIIRADERRREDSPGT